MTARETESLAAVVINLAAERARRRAKIQVRGDAPAAQQSVPRLPAATRPRHRHPRARQGSWEDE